MSFLSAPTSESNLESQPIPLSLPIMPTDQTAIWSTDTTPGVTLAVDNDVLFEGRPSLRVIIPAGMSGIVKLGTNAANALVPYLWNRSNFALAVRFSNLALTSGVNCYLGDAGYANFWVNSFANLGNFPEQLIAVDEWWVTKPQVSDWIAGAGAPVIASQMRCKIQFTATAQATDTVMWVGLYGVMPNRPKPTIVMTFDDGYASWNSFIKPLALHYRIPISMGISSGLVGSANFLTSTQVMSLFEDESRLFDIVNHSKNNFSYNDLGAAAYYANVIDCMNYLRRLGIYGDGPLHHPIVQSVWGNDLIALFESGPMLSARASTVIYESTQDQLIYGGDKLRWFMNIASNLQIGKTLAQAIADVEQIVAWNGYGCVNAHDFASADGAYVWSYSNAEQFFGYLAAQRDAGVFDIVSWSKWYADITGRTTDRR